jgi:hypothetical protein
MDSATRRLSENRVSLESQTAPGTFVPQISENYSYDPAGNVTAISKDDGGKPGFQPVLHTENQTIATGPHPARTDADAHSSAR